MFVFIEEEEMQHSGIDNDFPPLSPNVCLEGSGMYCLIESVLDEFTFENNNKPMIANVGSKYTEEQKRNMVKGREPDFTNVFLVSCDSIKDTISGIPNIGGERGDYLLIQSSDNWSFIFSDYLDDFPERI